jgi:hypothetical protein
MYRFVVQMVEEEKSEVSCKESELKSRCDELEREVTSLRRGGGETGGGGSSPAEDEGISSSGHDEREPLAYEMYTINNQTIIIDPKHDVSITI